MERALALVVDSDPGVRAVIRDVFEEHEVSVLGAGDGDAARELLETRPVGILLIDLQAPGADGLDVLPRERNTRHAPILIGLVPQGDGAEATRLVKAGAFDVLAKPLDGQMLQQVAHRTTTQYETLDQLRRLRKELQGREGYHGMVGRSAAMERLRERLRQLGPTTTRVWFAGETGTGKELAARTLHGLSSAGEAAFIVVSCGELTEHGWSDRWHGDEGWLAQANGGSLYLENVTDLSLDLQDRLMKTVADGSTIRLLASSTMDPSDAVEQGRLLVELHRFLAGELLALPRLHERPEDIPLLASHFIDAVCEINHLPSIRLAPEALSLMEQHRWPRDVQELRNTMEQAVMLSTDGTITPRELGESFQRDDHVRNRPRAVAAKGASLGGFRDAKREIVEAFERGYLRELMVRHGGNVTAASQQAGMLRSALQRLLRKYGLKSAEFRDRRRVVLATEESARTTVD